ncbi:MAG: hypothetical protein IJ147_10355 [Lachnospiraceae bacterium]|nr:hypothetical protein [Lachnospiraceae bacterium]
MRKHSLLWNSTTALLIGCLLMPATPLNAAADTPEGLTNTVLSEDSPVQETSSETIYIRNTTDLLDLADHCHSDDWSTDKTVELTQDILLSSDFTSIPIFNGYFKGNGHTISGYRYGGDGYVTGFFRYVGKDGFIENLKVAGAIRTPAAGSVTGGIAGINYGTIWNCEYSGTIRSDSDTGGIVGINESSGTVQNCINNSEILGYYFTGGIAGKNYGVLQSCSNKGMVNGTKEWVTEDDEKSPNLLSGLRDETEEIRIESGTDTGGIAGMSKGFIRNCSNAGTVGYEHVGYNIGGITGRQAGGIENCTNRGEVLGRKDVGGIVGQMEPYIAITDEDSVKKSVTTLHASIDTAINDVDDSNDALNKDINELKYYSDQTTDISNEMYDNTRDYINTNTEAANHMIGRISDSINSLNRIAAGISMEDPDDVHETMKELKNEIETNENISEADRARASAKYAEAEGYYNELSASLHNIASLEEQLINETDPVKRAALEAQLQAERINAQTIARKLQNALGDIHSILSVQTDLHLVQIDRSLDSNVEDLHSNLNNMSEVLKRISDDSSKYSKTFTNDLRKVNDNLMAVYDALDTRVSELTSNDGILYTDVSDVEILTATLGKVSSSTNHGIVKGDINIGGIAGSLAIDEEDPEGNAAGSVDKNLDATYTTQNIIHACINDGYVTAKNDGVGGIAGFMRHGVINASKGYGSVTSTGGGYVGGIAGQSLSVIKDSYVLSTIAGGDYVGGIAGFGTTIKSCYSMPTITAHTGRYGALCGQIKIDADTEVPHLENITDNYYVSEYLNGIDNIDYHGSIDRISYDTLISLPDLPYEFRSLHIIFRADDKYVGFKNVQYGSNYADIEFPDVPAKSGYYGIWADPVYETVQGNLVLDAEYKENITVLKSNDVDTPKRTLGYIDDVFNGDASLAVEEITGDPSLSYPSAKDYVIYRVALSGVKESRSDYRLRLFNPFDSAIEVYALAPNSSVNMWTPVTFKTRGSYAETALAYNSTEPSVQIYCLVKKPDHTPYIIGACAAAVLLLLLMILTIRRHKKRAAKKAASRISRGETTGEPAE